VAHGSFVRFIWSEVLELDMIHSTLEIYADCDSQDPSPNCHNSIDNSLDPITDDLSQDAFHTWLEEEGWLVLGKQIFCPECRKQLHD